MWRPANSFFCIRVLIGYEQIHALVHNLIEFRISVDIGNTEHKYNIDPVKCMEISGKGMTESPNIRNIFHLRGEIKQDENLLKEQ